ncbi:zinc finger protein 773-like [Rattus norvegicus]|uniref:zinc finger protein 773-like n=1 Tax=Rattus norvegicus TaxID=10116 RepID=UPI001917609F|nr:zinc finger protein 773-like isoform X2 [Rattus norvegicus]
MAEAPVNQGESYVSLEDVCLRFTAEEWGLLDDAQKLLYHNVMLENFSLVLSLGLPISKSFPGITVETPGSRETALTGADWRAHETDFCTGRSRGWS